MKHRMNRYTYILLALSLIAVSCIKNTLSYPRVKGEVVAFEVEGQKSVNIDSENRIVDIVLDETADEKSVKVLNYAYSEMSVPEWVAGVGNSRASQQRRGRPRLLSGLTLHSWQGTWGAWNLAVYKELRGYGA